MHYGGRSLNETFCRALLRARLTEEDIAARLGVDPKTVRRWIEGRALPYRRHRWALAAMLDTAETDLWPELRSAQPRPAEVVAVYPHLGTVPHKVWLHFFGSAEEDISVLGAGGLPVADDRKVMTSMEVRARAGVTIRICLANPGIVRATLVSGPNASAFDVDAALELYAPLRGIGQVRIRLYRGALYNFIYRVDDQILVAQRAHGIPAADTPVLHLRRTDDGDMFITYVESFERTWADARALT
jgi:transcriptional regulator with XRE-family HTH domain